MRPIRDPEGVELKHLIAARELSGKNMLEIGCGDGKFIRQYVGLPKSVIGIDPAFDELHTAMSIQNGSDSHFIQAEGEQLPFPALGFDIALFACTL